MNKVVLGIVIVIALIVVGGFFYLERGNTLPLDEPADVGTGTNTQQGTRDITAENNATASLEGDMIEEIVVAYTDSGFEPRSVTIQEGQTVRFVNQSSRGMWIGSDSHPTHTLYPVTSESDCLGSSFDTCESLQNGESWEFTFGEVGSWGYHNHVQASHRGTVIVQ